MTKDPLGDFKGKTIQDLLNETNPKFHIFLRDALNLHRIRAVELCTYLLNFQIQMNYFNSFKTLIREVPELLPDPENFFTR